MTETSVILTGGRSEAGGSPFSTFVLTDIEGSTRLWEEHGDAMGAALAVHDRVVRGAVEGGGGAVIKTTGDGILAVFADPVAAVMTALSAQRSLRDVEWGSIGALRVRIAIHAGAAETRDGDFFGPALNRDARILAIGHGGQILLSAVAAALARDRLPGDIELLDRGSHRLRDLDRPEQIFQVATADLPRDFPPLRSLSTRRSNLPVAVTSFVGRERERAEIGRLLERGRLVTLIGTGGTGKTRLMLESAGEITARFPDGVWLAELAPLTDAAQIAPEIARALGVAEQPGRPTLQVVGDFLAGKDLLLLIDNAEHLIDGVAEVAHRLLADAPGLRILTTSREALAVPGEAVVQVPSLSCPGGLDRSRMGGPPPLLDIDEVAGTEAVRLFAERAGAVLPSFELTTENVEAVAEICRRLDGIPLAIELAAGRVSAMSPQEIAVGLGDRFRLLTGGRRSAVPRQQTLHALIDWSWDLLTDDDRRLLRRLAIFAGGWTAGAAARIVGEDTAVAASRGPTASAPAGLMATVDGLSRLVDRSLVLVDRGATTRYRMLETIRQYARERLIESDEAEPIAARHLEFFAAMAEQAAPELHGPAMVDWLDRLDSETENIGVALEWSLESDPDTAVRMCSSMLAYWRVRAPSPDNQDRIVASVEVARRLEAGPPEPTTAQRIAAARLLGQAAWTWSSVGRADMAVGWAAEAMALARVLDDKPTLITAMIGDSITRIFSGAHFDFSGGIDEILALATETGDNWTIAMVAGGVASVLSLRDPAAAEQLLSIGMAAARVSGNPQVIATTSMGQGRLLTQLGRTAEGRALLEDAIARFAEIGDERFVAMCRSELAHALRRAGQVEEAMAMYRDLIHVWVRSGNRGAVAHQLESIAFAQIAGGSTERAASLLGAASALRDAAHSPMIEAEQVEHDEWLERLRAAGDPSTVDAARAAGRAMPMSEAVAIAVS